MYVERLISFLNERFFPFSSSHFHQRSRDREDDAARLKPTSTTRRTKLPKNPKQVKNKLFKSSQNLHSEETNSWPRERKPKTFFVPYLQNLEIRRLATKQASQPASQGEN